MRAVLIICVLCGVTIICPAQKKNKKASGQNTLLLERSLPVYIRPYSLQLCNSNQLIDALRDSLAKEGFTIIDSAHYTTLVRSFFLDDMYHAIKDVRDLQELERHFYQKVNGKKIAQEVFIKNSSCLDTLLNYTIQVYVFPRAVAETKTISFTLPFSSPARMLDIILSLIEREPPKK